MTELLTATDLEQWSERNDSREHPPTLVRRLILAVATPETLRMPRLHRHLAREVWIAAGLDHDRPRRRVPTSGETEPDIAVSTYRPAGITASDRSMQQRRFH